MNKIESTMVEMISCANENGYHNHAEGIQEALDRILDEGMLTELYGDAWYDGFMAAVKAAKSHDIECYTEADVLQLSEVAESEWNGTSKNRMAWHQLSKPPQESGRYTVHSSYGVRDAYFTTGLTQGDFRWQDCETGNDEGMENMEGVVYQVFSWTYMPTPDTNGGDK
ncbi:MAG: hypothetical protein ACK5M8_22085 [Shewanella algae]